MAECDSNPADPTLPRAASNCTGSGCGRFPCAARSMSKSVGVGADIFDDGHDKLAAALLYRRVASVERLRGCAMESLGNDRWQAALQG